MAHPIPFLLGANRAGAATAGEWHVLPDLYAPPGLDDQLGSLGKPHLRRVSEVADETHIAEAHSRGRQRPLRCANGVVGEPHSLAGSAFTAAGLRIALLRHLLVEDGTVLNHSLRKLTPTHQAQRYRCTLPPVVGLYQGHRHEADNGRRNLPAEPRGRVVQSAPTARPDESRAAKDPVYHCLEVVLVAQAHELLDDLTFAEQDHCRDGAD